MAAALLLAGAAAHLTPPRAPVAEGFAPLQWAPAAYDGAVPDNDAWTLGEPPARGAAWVRTRFSLEQADMQRGSPALVLSGVFSARAYLNGAPIGDKGRASLTPDAEIPGPIDAVIPLGGQARVGENELLLFISLHAARHRPGMVIQDLSIAPHGAEPLRPLGRYVVALSQVGFLLVLGAALTWSAARRRLPTLRWPALAACFLLLALLAETLRAWWSYPFSLHIVRQAAVWAALFGFSACLFAGACTRAGGAPWRFIALVIVLAIASVWFGNGVDLRIMASFVAFAAAAAWVSWRPAAAGDAAAQALVALLSAAIVFALLKPAQFLDNGVYLLGALMLAVFLWVGLMRRDTYDLPHAVAHAPSDAGHHRILFVKAEGNYAEVHAVNGERQFLRQTLSEYPVSASLVRVHRSYIVNLAHARRLVANTGSRYHLELTGGACVPVSRKLVGAVRNRLRALNAVSALRRGAEAS